MLKRTLFFGSPGKLSKKMACWSMNPASRIHVMEPYRPFADELVFANRQYFSVPALEKEYKARLLQLLIADVKINGERRPLMNALSYTTASLVRCFQKEEKSISYPEFYES